MDAARIAAPKRRRGEHQCRSIKTPCAMAYVTTRISRFLGLIEGTVVLTNRDLIKQRFRWFAAISVLGWCVAVFSPHAGKGFGPVQITGFVLIVVGVGLVRLIRCPNCSRVLGRFAQKIAISWFGSIDFCPYCGIRFDAAKPSQPT
jgi:hypothetical protein